ncbi:MAG: hypothetical protein H0A75_03405 [Candidatus Methanofishera endochildressiae]|uniref:Uncharacterized protein n=1 Tax=Candidatus Methanofishera endochildressiae TaxID=2738884 RepID=A0A7Z0MN82_9GAMM|nr:hypothetical protein [Candidatus Methanofishera endochildressiae]
MIQQIINRAPLADDCITIFTDTKEMARELEKILSSKLKVLPEQIALLHGENKAGDDDRTYSQDFWANIDGHLNQFKFMVTSPVIGSGISLEKNINDNAFFFFTGHLNIPAYLQQAARNRVAKKLHIYFQDNATYEGELLNSREKISLIGKTPL